jgi:hypothetical protein
VRLCIPKRASSRRVPSIQDNQSASFYEQRSEDASRSKGTAWKSNKKDLFSFARALGVRVHPASLLFQVAA